LDGFANQAARILDVAYDRQPARVDLGEIGEILDQARHVLCRPLDRRSMLPYTVAVQIRRISSGQQGSAGHDSC
jgi:hypothetical protein